MIGDAPVAMGDRAGTFAYFYNNPVSQLEGLMNDATYFRRVAKRQPVRDLLCARGIRYHVHFDRDLGDYSTHAMEPFSPVTTSFKGPTIEVSKSDEVGRIDIRFFRIRFKENPYVYIWKLNGC